MEIVLSKYLVILRVRTIKKCCKKCVPRQVCIISCNQGGKGWGGGRIKDVGRDALVYVFDSESHLFHILQQHLLPILIAKM